MALAVKLCGLSTEETVEAAIAGGASHVGFVFHPKSPRAVTPGRAADLARLVRPPVLACGLFVDAAEDDIRRTLDRVPLDILQLHGAEPPERCRFLRERTGRKVMKAIPVATDADIRAAERWYGAVDLLLFDAKPSPGGLPGGNGVPFDWSLLAGRSFPVPWFLAGGLDPENVAEAVRRTRAPGVDVSSGIESSPGIKDRAKMAAFLAAVA
ncbi:MAG TPA: phosphoribosylanthranilate isomerase [Stellaceae bacterium]|nr:phosphoribosylanthranilate isomerase [Stellaceae bacterium]